VLFKKALVIALSAILALPLLGQQAVPSSPEMPIPGYRPVAELARLNAPQAPQPGVAAAQEAEPAQPAGQLTIEVLEGEGAQNDINAETATAPKVRVLNEAGNPVEDAEVVFQLPMGGPSAVFSGWVRTQTLRTDASGVAAASALTPNEIPGDYNIKVTATHGNSRGAATIPQSNVEVTTKKSHKKRWIIIGAIAAGAVAAIAIAASGDDDDTTKTLTPVTISPGGITVGGPK
jgi:hypothetical protein